MASSAYSYKLKSNPKVTISSGDLEDFYLQSIEQMGYKTSKEVLNGAFLDKASSNMFTTKPAKPARQAQFNQTGTGIPINSTTVAVTDLLREIGTVVEENSYFSTEIQDTLSQSVTVVVETVDRVKGVQSDRKTGQPFDVVAKLGNQSASFTPEYSGEKIVVDEQDILALREIGVNNFSIRGIAQYMAFWTDQLAVRAYTKRNILLQEAIFTGSYTWKGQTFSFGVPSGNTLVPITNQPWATLVGGVYQMNPAALPLTDIRYYISNNAAIRRLKPFLKGLVMNRNTHNWFYTSPEVQQLVQYGYMANPTIIGKETRGITMAGAVEYFLGGDRNVSVYVDDTTYMADANDPLGNADNSVNYFIPDGQVLFVFDLSKYGGQTVDFVYTPAVQNGGSFLDARPGLFMVMEDLTQAGTYGGYENPSIKLLCGFNGMPRIKRPNDLFILNTLA